MQETGEFLTEDFVLFQQDKIFREKFTSFLHQYELRELYFQSMLRMKDLEIAYHMSRHDQLKKAQESELSKSHQLTRQVSTFSQTENELRGQLNVYVEKFKQVSFASALRPFTHLHQAYTFRQGLATALAIYGCQYKVTD